MQLACRTSNANQPVSRLTEPSSTTSHRIRHASEAIAMLTNEMSNNSFKLFFIDHHDVRLGAAEQELHVLGCQLLHGDFVLVDCAVDHVRLLLLQHNHARLNRIFNAQACNDTRPLLTDTVATIGRLPFGCWVPPSGKCVS